ncbi:class I adenylate-forming enzyme family protein [Pseudonocardia sp. MH-G8]|uniref:class I adenylate-forming enzyme family protein n=1 Tax=Pseudonocardia sp. MH-G8 TaxID=1854588 RepID=UPI000BA0906D|nr:AMP-binding protein [Pseudonocardia sp. MH-G8]OZM80749.1 fatty-acid--CoA ligase [Pseudonocardia sp. MH-G8]
MRISDVVAFAAMRAPEVTALEFEDRAWSYRELHADVCRLAHGLGSIARPGDRVAVLTENNPEYVLAYYGVPLAGMALVFVNHRLAPREVVDLLSDSTPSVLVTEGKFLYTARAAAAAVDSIRTIVTVDGPAEDALGFAALLDGRPATEPAPPDEDAPAWLLYTSGTTGRAKGAVLTHRNVAAAVVNAGVSWSRGGEERVVSLCPWPLCHIAGYGVLVSHMVADTVVLLRRYDPEGFLAAVARHRVTSTTVAPTMLAMLLRHPAFDSYDTSSITRIGYGSAPMPVATLREGMRRFPNASFQTGFGMTELAGNVLVHSAEDHVAAAAGRTELLASVGRPMAVSAVRVVDETGTDCAPDEVGELVVRGDQVCSAYWNRPDASAEAFRDGWFHSGDLARRDAEGYFYIVDRRKDMILTGGENVYSREVEEVLHQHPAVAAAAVVGVPDEVWGERVVAVIEPLAGQRPTGAEIREFCAGQLAGYKCPRQVLIVDGLPRNTVGKILKRELRARVRDAVDTAGSPS